MSSSEATGSGVGGCRSGEGEVGWGWGGALEARRGRTGGEVGRSNKQRACGRVWRQRRRHAWDGWVGLPQGDTTRGPEAAAAATLAVVGGRMAGGRAAGQSALSWASAFFLAKADLAVLAIHQLRIVLQTPCRSCIQMSSGASSRKQLKVFQGQN